MEAEDTEVWSQQLGAKNSGWKWGHNGASSARGGVKDGAWAGAAVGWLRDFRARGGAELGLKISKGDT